MKFLTLTLSLLATTAYGQSLLDQDLPPIQTEDPTLVEDTSELDALTDRAEFDGVEVRIKDIARFRGVRGNQLTGIGLVVGLEGTGDSRSTPFTATLLANAMKDWGSIVDPTDVRSKNVATVTVTAELPAFAAPGNRIDVTVQSIGDARSLQGGFLLMAPLSGPSDRETVFAMAQGPLSIGGFNVQGGGSSVQRNHTNVGRIPGGAIVEKGVDTQFVFQGDTLFLELERQDMTTAQRIATAIPDAYPELWATAVDGGTVRVRLPGPGRAMEFVALIEGLVIRADVPAVVVVNERTGTIVVGGNVRLGPALVAHGGLQIKIDSRPVVSESSLFETGEHVADDVIVEAREELVQTALLRPSTTIRDLATILQTLQVSARDVIAIFQALKEQGALKAQLKLQ